jgi:nucleotide-binding universal stress UspA family protein
MTHQLPHAGEIIDGFTLHEEIHRGGMASIWSVTHPDHTLPMCMKLPLILEGDEPGMIVSFEAEQMIMPRLTGPYVPRIIAIGDFTDRPHIVMELVKGKALDALVEKAPLPWAEVSAIAAEVAKALHSLHVQNCNHLDLKPGNIILRPDGRVVLIDYGLSRDEDLPDLLAEETRLPIGTGAFIAPEQVLGQRTEPRSDQFALGVIMYLLVTGKYPFGENVQGAALRERLWRDPEPPRALNKELPPVAQEIILRCLSVDPQERFASAAQLAYSLRNQDQMRLTGRAQKTAADSWWTVMQRKRKAPKALPPNPVSGRVRNAPIIAVAVDLSEDQIALADEVKRVLGRLIAVDPLARLVCLNVYKTSRIGIDQMVTDDGESLHVRRLVELRHWAGELNIDVERVSYHILEATDPAEAIIKFIKHNQIDHLVMGARSASQFRRYLGSVSSAVVAEAPCSVTIVRLAARNEDEDEASRLAQAALPA